MELTTCHALIISVFAIPAAIAGGWFLGSYLSTKVNFKDLNVKGAMCFGALLALFMVFGVSYNDCNKEDTITRMVPEKVETVLASTCSCGN